MPRIDFVLDLFSIEQITRSIDYVTRVFFSPAVDLDINRGDLVLLPCDNNGITGNRNRTTAKICRKGSDDIPTEQVGIWIANYDEKTADFLVNGNILEHIAPDSFFMLHNAGQHLIMHQIYLKSKEQ